MQIEFDTKPIAINSSLSEDTKDLLKCLLRVDYVDRYDSTQTLNHPAIVKHLSLFEKPLSNDDIRVLIRNYLLNSLNSEHRVMPDIVLDFLNNNEIIVVDEFNDEQTLDYNNDFFKDVVLDDSEKGLLDSRINFFSIRNTTRDTIVPGDGSHRRSIHRTVDSRDNDVGVRSGIDTHVAKNFSKLHINEMMPSDDKIDESDSLIGSRLVVAFDRNLSLKEPLEDDSGRNLQVNSDSKKHENLCSPGVENSNRSNKDLLSNNQPINNFEISYQHDGHMQVNNQNVNGLLTENSTPTKQEDNSSIKNLNSIENHDDQDTNSNKNGVKPHNDNKHAIKLYKSQRQHLTKKLEIQNVAISKSGNHSVNSKDTGNSKHIETQGPVVNHVQPRPKTIQKINSLQHSENMPMKALPKKSTAFCNVHKNIGEDKERSKTFDKTPKPQSKIPMTHDDRSSFMDNMPFEPYKYVVSNGQLIKVHKNPAQPPRDSSKSPNIQTRTTFDDNGHYQQDKYGFKNYVFTQPSERVSYNIQQPMINKYMPPRTYYEIAYTNGTPQVPLTPNNQQYYRGVSPNYVKKYK